VYIQLDGYPKGSKAEAAVVQTRTGTSRRRHLRTAMTRSRSCHTNQCQPASKTHLWVLQRQNITTGT